jgi:hypothetical protein
MTTRASMPTSLAPPLALASSRLRWSLSRTASWARALSRRAGYLERRARVPSEQRGLARETDAMRDSLRGRGMFLLGTGPSLGALDLRPLASHLTMGVNSFYRHPIIAEWQPTHFAMMDGALFVNGDSMTPFFADLGRALPRSEYFVPSMFVNQIREHGWLPPGRTHYVPMDGELSDEHWADIDVSLLPYLPNAIQFALAMAIHLGCSPIVLLGVDHDWAAKPFLSQANDTHFHAGPTLHFGPSAIKVDFNNYQEITAYCCSVWRAYDGMKRVAEGRGIRIVNASPGSFLDVFERASLVSLLRNMPPGRNT